jgi:lysophospholipase L1-like esterase
MPVISPARSSKTTAGGIGFIILTAIFSSLPFACAHASASYSLTESDKTALKIVKTGYIYFSHKSVGNNLLRGLNRQAGKAGTSLNIVAVRKHPTTAGGALLHSQGGSNGKPASKISSFASTLTQISPPPQIAFMKFCYVDFNAKTDINKLFSIYKATINQLKKDHPETIIAHITVPLTTSSNNWKTRIKRALGSSDRNNISNIKRNEFNKLLVDTFPKELVFDLAKFESTHQNGDREYFIANGNRVYALAAEYTSDGGHLNDLGQQYLATKMALFLANILSNRLHISK